jgi:hypothetical protein
LQVRLQLRFLSVASGVVNATFFPVITMIFSRGKFVVVARDLFSAAS